MSAKIRVDGPPETTVQIGAAPISVEVKSTAPPAGVVRLVDGG